MKTILISIPFGMSARNFLRSDVFPILKKQARIIIVSPLADNEAFRKEFESPNVVLYSLSHRRNLLRSLVWRILAPIQTYWFTERTQLKTLLDLKALLKKTEPWRYWFYVLLAQTLGRMGLARSFLSTLFRRSIWNPQIEELFNRESVDLVFTTHGYIPLEIELAIQAQKRKILVVNMIHSWDNITCKSGLRQITNPDVGTVLPVQLYDRIIVWNEILREELKELYGIPENKIYISGVPQFDIYPTISQNSDKEKFFGLYGMDPTKKLIFFVTTHPSMIHDQTSIMKDLVQALRTGRFVEPCQLLIRTHPGAAMTEWFELFKGPDVFFQKPTSSFTPREITSWEGKNDNPTALAEAICHCDVMIHGMSTTAIEAAVFDKPCISMGYDGDPAFSPETARFFENSHYSKLVRTHMMKIARSPQQLIDQINAYLQNPDLDQEGRGVARLQQCYRLDGKSAERIAQYLLDLLNS